MISNTQRNRLAFLQSVYPDLAGQVQGMLQTEMYGIAVGNGVYACVENGNIYFGLYLTEQMKGWLNAQETQKTSSAT